MATLDQEAIAAAISREIERQQAQHPSLCTSAPSRAAAHTRLAASVSQPASARGPDMAGCSEL